MSNDNWQTPDWLMKHFKNHFDPCPANADFDGLNVDWKDPCYVNPPYSTPGKWIKKAIEESKKGINVVMLLRVDPSTRWYRFLIEEDVYIAFFNRRIKFKSAKASPNFASMLVFIPAKNNDLQQKIVFFDGEDVDGECEI